MPLINTRGAASIKGFGFAGFSPTVPGMPTSVSATATSCSSISVSFTTPACNGGLSIDYYQAVCTATGTHSATGSSPISITGLSSSTSYTFQVRAHNSLGYGSYSSSTGTATTQVAASSQSYTSSGSYSWVAPTGVTSVSAVVVGAPNSNYYAGALSYKNNISVSPGSSYNATVGTSGCITSFINSSTVYAFCGSNRVGDGGGNGGYSGHCSGCGFGGGGAGGYSGNGGRGFGPSGAASAGSGGGGGGGGGSNSYTRGCCCGFSYWVPNYAAGGGGGVGIYGQGSNGAAGTNGCGVGTTGGGGGSGGTAGGNVVSAQLSGAGGNYGGARGTIRSGGTPSEGSAAVRIVWPGNTRTFPSTSVGSP